MRCACGPHMQAAPGAQRTHVRGVHKLLPQRLEPRQPREAVHLRQRQLERQLVGARRRVGPVPEQRAQVDPKTAGAQHVVDHLRERRGAAGRGVLFFPKRAACCIALADEMARRGRAWSMVGDLMLTSRYSITLCAVSRKKQVTTASKDAAISGAE